MDTTTIPRMVTDSREVIIVDRTEWDRARAIQVAAIQAAVSARWAFADAPGGRQFGEKMVELFELALEEDGRQGEGLETVQAEMERAAAAVLGCPLGKRAMWVTYLLEVMDGKMEKIAFSEMLNKIEDDCSTRRKLGRW